MGTVGDDSLASIRAHECSHLHLSTSTARFITIFFPSFAERPRANTVLARYTDIAWVVWSVCTAGPDMAALVLLERVLDTAAIDDVFATLATLEWDKTPTPPMLMLDRIVRAVRSTPDAASKGLHIEEGGTMHLHVDTSTAWAPNNGWTQLMFGMLGAGSGQLMRSTATFEYLLAVPRGLLVGASLATMAAHAARIMAVCSDTGLMRTDARHPHMHADADRRRALDRARAFALALDSVHVPLILTVYDTTADSRLAIFAANADYTRDPSTHETALVCRRLNSPAMSASLPAITLALAGASSAGELRLAIESTMRASHLPVAMRIHDLIYLDKRLQSILAWLSLPAVRHLEFDTRAAAVCAKLAEECAASAAHLRGGGVAASPTKPAETLEYTPPA